MAQITYSLGGTSFDAVPENLSDSRTLAIRSEATIGRAKVHSIGVDEQRVTLSGRYMSPATRDAILTLFQQCRETGATVEFNDGYTDRNVLIHSFETVPLIGKTEGFSFRIELMVIG